MTKREPFFSKEGEGIFFPALNGPDLPFFSPVAIQPKCSGCKRDSNLIQRQEQPETAVTQNVAPSQPRRFSRANKCATDPEFPDFPCLTTALKLDIDENLWKNAHHFYRTASLYPGDNEMMWNTFLRYGLGVNLLQTNFGFLGAKRTMGTMLSYGTGIGLKSFEFLKNGKLELDGSIPLGRGVSLDIKFDLNTDPNNLRQVKGVNTSVGISGHF